MNHFDQPNQMAQAHLALARKRLAAAANTFATANDQGSGDKAARPIHSAAVIGAGTMGSGIAAALVSIGIPTVLIDSDEVGLSKGLARIKRINEAAAEKGKITTEECSTRLSLVSSAFNLAAVSKSDLIIEAVFEDMSLKKKIFSELNQIAKPGAILATNTSGLDIDEIASVTSRASDVIGAHFFSPAHVQKLLEVVRTRHSSPDVIAALLDLGNRMGKVSVLARVYPGFIGNALFRQYHREAHFLLEEGALPYQVDAALKQFGYAMGLFAVHDMAGNDVGYQARKAQMASRLPDRRYCDLITSLCDMGRLGQKSGKGWYRYEAPDRTPLRDEEIETWIANDAVMRGFSRRPIDDEEIIDRCVLGMMNEGAKLLELGIAERAGDIDLVYTTGYGFPVQRGGPMHYADSLGLDKVLAKIKALHLEHGDWWIPAPLLVQLVAQGKTFEQWDHEKTNEKVQA
jgi:3-hydroxyacyl-CoA dehydrogenase